MGMMASVSSDYLNVSFSSGLDLISPFHKVNCFHTSKSPVDCIFLVGVTLGLVMVSH